MKYLELLEQTLNEINMSPSALKQAAAGIDARAGMEFEMIVPDIGSLDDDDFESEPDYDQDESISDFEDIRNFFHDGDYNGRRAVDRLMEDIEQEYYDSDWLSEKKHDMWMEAATESISDLVERDYSDTLYDQAVEEIEKESPDFGVGSDEFREAVEQRHAELVKEKVDEILADMGSEYDDAFNDWDNDTWQDIQNDSDTQREWLEYQGYNAMSDIANNFDIEWPHWTEPGSEYGSGGENAQRIADEFSEFINKKVNFSMSYHGGRREPGAYVVEPDGSLEGDNAGDQGLEFVSPPMPINELLADLIAVKEFAENNGCYTNESTGLHINVSVPGFSMEKLDYVKLAILLGDERVLNEFGRLGNTYTKSALQIVKQNIKQRPEDAAALLGKMREHLSTAAAKAIHSGVTSKYTSINTKTGYIEFRSPGGDWLGANYELIEPTLLRFVVALDAALDETKYRQEYAKKLYKLLAPSSDEPGILELFANYSAGELDKEALIRQVRSAQLSRNIAKGKVSAGAQYWWRVSRPGHAAEIEVVAKNKEEAIAKASEPGNYPEWRGRQDVTAKPIRPYEEKPTAQASTGAATPQRPENTPPASGEGMTGNWGLWLTNANRFARWPNSQDLRRFSTQDVAQRYLDDLRQSNPLVRGDIEVRNIEQAADASQFQEPNANRGDLTPRGPGPWEIYRLSDGSSVRELSNTSRPEAEQEARNALGLRAEAPELYGVRTRQQRAQQHFTGYWDVKIGDEVVFRVQAETQGEANNKAREWIMQRSPEFRQQHQGGEVSVTPRYE